MRREGFDVTAVADGQAALAAAAERTPAVAVLDVSMPGVDGLEARLAAALAVGLGHARGEPVLTERRAHASRLARSLGSRP